MPRLRLVETCVVIVIGTVIVSALVLLLPWFRVTTLSPPSCVTTSTEPQIRTAFSLLDIALKIFGLVAVLIGFVFTFHQLKASNDRVRVTAVLDRMRQLSDPRVVEARRGLYEIYCDGPHRFESIRSRDDTGPELRQFAEVTIRTIGEIGILLHHDFVDSDFIIERMPLFPARMWIILSTYIGIREPQAINNDLPFAYVAYVSLSHWCRLNKDKHDASLHVDASIPSKSRRIPAVRVEGMRRELGLRLRAAGWTFSLRRDRVWGHSRNIVVGTVVERFGNDTVAPAHRARVVVEAQTEVDRWESVGDRTETDSGGVFYIGVERGPISWFRLRVEKRGFRNVWSRPVRNDPDNCILSVDCMDQDDEGDGRHRTCAVVLESDLGLS